jgi:hypothetical protein
MLPPTLKFVDSSQPNSKDHHVADHATILLIADELHVLIDFAIGLLTLAIRWTTRSSFVVFSMRDSYAEA